MNKEGMMRMKGMVVALLVCAFMWTGAALAEELPPESIDAQIENLVGSAAMDPLPPRMLNSAQGRETFINRRSYLARHAGARSVPQQVFDWRTPGSQMGEWVAEVRSAAGVPPSEISANPSYREVMHAMVVDRFNTGQYAVGMLTDEAAIAKETLIMSSMQLMQLRDYYELLERTALTLAIQVAWLTDQAQVPDVQGGRPQ